MYPEDGVVLRLVIWDWRGATTTFRRHARNRVIARAAPPVLVSLGEPSTKVRTPICIDIVFSRHSRDLSFKQLCEALADSPSALMAAIEEAETGWFDGTRSNLAQLLLVHHYYPNSQKAYVIFTNRLVGRDEPTS
eukprot:CAMPEP_0197691576 /NCGR_PEP_ID=MMETSP1338-20131121/109915_1 /TAXON_ID=43686 ORGANISM="Pelagodinium beii, Strain RCC1491" /NCGR_SAMPLE_ID=MMETSP1338 /ASSEMBLY_ACC=CAM_ASM_000754 /LENGTH=134 /DNA_ID=CAMNT_0043274141 /DNA_START=128 /DNA_END=532 /DNA_ORIENTATION=+